MISNAVTDFHCAPTNPNLQSGETIEATTSTLLRSSLNPHAHIFIPRALLAHRQAVYPMYSWSTISPQAEMRYIRDAAEADKEVQRLKEPLGFDMEWHSGTSFKGPQGKTAVIQICDDTRILIIQISAMSTFPSRLQKILESPHVMKMGVGVLGDGHKLRRDFGIVANGLLELGSFVKLVDPPSIKKHMISLKNAVQEYTGYTLLKGVFEKSDWEAILSPEQLEYAANDAHAALFVFTALLERARAKGLVVKPIIVSNSLGMGITYIEDGIINQEN